MLHFRANAWRARPDVASLRAKGSGQLALSGTKLRCLSAAKTDVTSVGQLQGGASPSARSLARILRGSSSVKGLLKNENQDRLILPDLEGAPPKTPSGLGLDKASEQDMSRQPELVLTAVFDGHGGVNTSNHAAKRLRQILTDGDSKLFWEEQEGAPARHPLQVGLPEEEARRQRHVWHDAFSRLDAEILQESRQSGKLEGSTALAALHAGRLLSVANAGDCRAILSRGNMAVRLTRDHTPGDKAERERIVNAGGIVRQMKGVWRVVLPTPEGRVVKLVTTSRGLGDRDYKEGGLLTCEPEVTSVVLQPDLDAFSVLATDGLWSYVPDQDVVDTIKAVLDEFSRMSVPVNLKSVASEAARKLVKLALDHGSVDDISVIVHLYDWGGQPEEIPAS